MSSFYWLDDGSFTPRDTIFEIIVFRFEYNLVLINFIMKALVSAIIFFCVALFGGMCWDREWLLYPNYNYPSWSYGVAVIAMVVNGVATFFMFIEARAAKEKRERNQNLIKMMYPSASGFSTGTMSSKVHLRLQKLLIFKAHSTTVMGYRIN